jgi:hypothetical protein
MAQNHNNLTKTGNKRLAGLIETYWMERGRLVKTNVVLAADIKCNPVYGVRSDLGLYLPTAIVAG